MCDINIKRYINRLVVFVLVSASLAACVFIGSSYEVFVSDTKVHYKLVNVRDNARLYISRTDTFNTDYVEFAHTTIMFPEFYYVEPDTLYFIDKNDWYGRSIKSNQFVIKKINVISSPEIIPGVTTVAEYEKGDSISRETQQMRSSIQERATNSIYISDYASGITVYNSQNEVVAKDEDPYVLAGH